VPLRAVLAVAGLTALVSLVPARRLAGQVVAEVQVTPETMTLAVGRRERIFAAAYDRSGNLIASAKFSFWSSDTSIARVARDGTVLGVSAGLAKVEARSQGRRASMAVLITGPAAADSGGHSPVATSGLVLTLDPDAVTLLPGESVALMPQAQREDGSSAPIGRVSWKSLKPEIALVDSAGTVLGVAQGRSIVQAVSASGLMATAPIEVEPAEFQLSTSRLVRAGQEADTLQAVVPLQGNRPLRNGLQWRSTDTAVVTVEPSGVVRTHTPGQAEVIVSGFGQERRVAVVVYRTPQTLVVTPSPSAGPVQLPLRGRRQFTAVALAADSTPVPEARAGWEVGDTTVVGYDPATGTLSAKAQGTTTLTARLGGFEPAVWNVQVVPGTLALQRTRLGLATGQRVSLSPSLLDDEGRVIGPATGIEWRSDRPEVAAIAAGGSLEALSPGHAVVTAAAPWGQAVKADVYVTGSLLVSSNRRGSFGIYQLRADRPDTLIPLVATSADEVQAVPSPDRTRIAFSSNRSGSYDLYLMDADGRNQRRLTTDAGSESDPVWTPDGSRIFYTSTLKSGDPQVYSVRADGSDPRPLATGTGGSRAPAISPDGRTVAFVSAREGNSEIYLVPIEGGEPRRLTKTSGRESYPRYLPDGGLIYVSEHGGRGKGSAVLQFSSATAQGLPLIRTDEPVTALDLSPDGQRVAYVVKNTGGDKVRAPIAFYVQGLAPGAPPTPVPLRPGEQVLSPSF
jgi:hypothetical protein